MSIETGQVYREAAPRDGQYPKRILIKGVNRYGSGLYGAGSARVVTLTVTGREVRSRHLSLDQLHDSSLTKDGQRRRTGYVLEAGQ